jgi:hypothetical protein
MSTMTLTLLLTMLAVPFALAVAWAFAHLLADNGGSQRLRPVRVERRPAPTRLQRR